MKFSKNVITGINLTKEFLNTNEISTYREAGKYISNAIQVLNNYDPNYSDLMFNNAREIVLDLREAFNNVQRNKLAVATTLKIIEVRTDNYLKMIFLPQERKAFE